MDSFLKVWMGLNIGLDINITKNRLNMFPEIPDFFPIKYLEMFF